MAHGRPEPLDENEPHYLAETIPDGVMHDLREHQCDNLTIGQYLAPSQHHLPVQRYVTPEEFAHYAVIACELLCADCEWPDVRSSYHAKEQARG